MKFSIMDFFIKCNQIHRKLRIWLHLLKKSLMENFIVCAVHILREDNYLLIFFEKRVKYFSFIFLISGGIVGFNQKANSDDKWTITIHLQAVVSGNFKAMMK